MNSILNIFMKGDPSRCSPVLNLNHKYFFWDNALSPLCQVIKNVNVLRNSYGPVIIVCLN